MPETTPERCELGSPVFMSLGPALFRRAAADGAPAMVVPMGERLAVLPLRAVQREFGIADASADGRMLGLIAQSLDYVAGLRLGDPLPPEVLSGDASWTPEPRHREAAGARLRRQLLAALDPEAAGASAEMLESDPRLRAAAQAAFARAADALGLPDAPAVLRLLAEVADELSYIEALREALLVRVQALVGRLATLGLDWRGNAERQATLIQVRRLAGRARDQLAARFAEITAQTGEAMSTLRNIDSQRAFIRAHRDWLHRARLGWEPVLAEWDGAPSWLDETAWARLGRTWKFLAPRFMPVQEWEAATTPGQGRRARKPGPVMTW